MQELEDACLAVLMRHDGRPLSETEVRDGLFTRRESRKQVRAALLSLVNTRRAYQVKAERLTRCTYAASPIKANL